MKSYKQLTNEVLNKMTPLSTWIDDFVHSKNSKFAGKSTAERIKMAKGAYYAAQRNESSAASQNSTAEVDMREAKEHHLVHVSDGSGYDETPHEKDIEHIKTGAMHTGGQWHGHSDKGAFFKFKSKEDAEQFKRHVDKCPHKSCYADHVNEAVEYKGIGTDVVDKKKKLNPQPNLMSDKKQVKDFKEEVKKPTGDLKKACWKGYTAVGLKMKNGRKVPNCVPEEVQVEEGKVYDPITKKMVATKPIKVQAGGGATRNGVPVETGPSKYKERPSRPGDIYGKSFTEEAYDHGPIDRDAKVGMGHKAAVLAGSGLDSGKHGTIVGSSKERTGDMWHIKTSSGDIVKMHKHRVAKLKEEVEQIDEVSKSTLVSYIDKASQDVHDKAMAAGSHHAGKSYKDFMANYAKSGKRQAGITKAAVKLAKEETIDEAIAKKLPVQHAVNAVHKTLGSKAATRFLGHLKPGTEKHTSWDKVNSALMKQGVQTKHIASIAQKTSHENVEESRGHKTLATFFKNREVAQRSYQGNPAKDAEVAQGGGSPADQGIAAAKKDAEKLKKESVNPALMAILKKRQEAQKKKEEDKKKVNEAMTPAVHAAEPKKTKSTAKEYTKASVPGTKRVAHAKPDDNEVGGGTATRINEDQYTSEYKIKYYVDPVTGENKTRKIRPHRVNFKASKMHGEPAQQDAPGDYGMKEGYVAEGGFDNYHEIAKELIKRHGKNVDTGHINDLAGERDTHRGLDHSEVMHHVNKILGSKEVKEGDEYDEQWKEYKGKTFKKESRMINFKDYLKEAHLSAKQKKIAAIAGDKDKIDADDLAALRAGKKPVEEAKKCMDEDDMDESGLRMAAHAAHKSGKKEFEFQGKTYPVKVQKEGVLKPELEKGFPAPGVKTGASAPKGTTYMPKKDVKEEVEQIDELSKKTLGSYAKKATKDVKSQKADYDYLHSDDDPEHEDDGSETMKGHDARRIRNRETGIDRAVGKLAKEEVEQIDELSKKTLGSYVNKAAKDSRIHGQIATDFENTADKARKQSKRDSFERLNRKYLEKAWKREDGIAKAVGKLTKEEVDLEEATTRKDFQMVADLIKGHESAEKRKELATHHAGIFKKQNPRFDHAKFMKAAGVNEEVELDEGRMKELAMDLKDMSHDEFHKQYGKPKSHYDPTNFKKPVEPGKGMERARALAQRGLQSVLSKEEVERIEEKAAQLDELSKKTLGSYAQKAQRDSNERKDDWNHDDSEPYEDDDDNETEKGADARKIHNRDTGVKRAIKKLAKEEVEQEMSPYLKATLQVMDEGKIDDLRDAQKLRQATQSAYSKGYKPDTSHPHIKVVKGTAYGGANQKDDEGDEKKDDEGQEKRGRGRPAGKVGKYKARGSKSVDKDVDDREFTLHLPK